MNLYDLKSGMRVRTRNNNMYLVIENYITEKYGKLNFILANFNGGGFNVPCSYSENMCNHSNNLYDIMEVYIPCTDNDILKTCESRIKSIWQRNEVTFDNCDNRILYIDDMFCDSRILRQDIVNMMKNKNIHTSVIDLRDVDNLPSEICDFDFILININDVTNYILLLISRLQKIFSYSYFIILTKNDSVSAMKELINNGINGYINTSSDEYDIVLNDISSLIDRKLAE